MPTKLENEAKREATIAKMEAQLKAWSVRIDDLVVGYLAAGAQPNDAYRLRIDALRGRHWGVQAKLDEYLGPQVAGHSWRDFRAAIAEDWAALDTGFKDLTC